MTTALADDRFALNRVSSEAGAVRLLREQLASLGQGEDDEALAISIESETGFKEIIEALVLRTDDDAEMVEAIGRQIDRLQTRRDRFKARIERVRALVATGMDEAGLAKLETAFGTVSVKNVPPKAVPVEEADIPSRFWKAAEPKLDTKALTAALRARKAALDSAAEITDPEARAAALKAADEEHPEIPGATLSNASRTIAIKRG